MSRVLIKNKCALKKRSIVEYLFLFYAFLLPFGSINPFDLSSIQGISERGGDQQGFIPIVFALCTIMAFIDKKVQKHFNETKPFLLPLSVFFVSIVFSTIISGSRLPFPTLYFIKLLMAETGFVLMAQYFVEYPRVLDKVLGVYAYTCAGIVAAFFLGLLDGYYFVSKGRLWLFGENPNIYSFMMGMGALLLINDVNYKSIPKWRKALNIISVFAIMLYMVLSGSRGSSLMLLLCVLILSKNIIKKHFLLISILCIILIWLVFWFVTNNMESISLFERFIALQDGNDDRTRLLKDAFSLYAERPILGFGRTGYVEQRLIRFHEDRDSHNMLLSVAVMSGSIGLLSILLFLWKLFRKCSYVIKQDILCVVIFLYVFLMSMKTGDVITFSMMWFCFAVVFARAIQSKEKKTRSKMQRI